MVHYTIEICKSVNGIGEESIGTRVYGVLSILCTWLGMSNGFQQFKCYFVAFIIMFNVFCLCMCAAG